MDPNNLVALQNSSKQIRNPFGFTFTTKWAKRPVSIPGDSQWYSMIGPLADHIANRLYMKIRYQFHDEQVAALKAKGDDRGARGYTVPRTVENQIWALITGLPKFNDLEYVEKLEDEADLTILKTTMSKMDAKAAKEEGVINVSKILEKAKVEALPTADRVDAKNASGHVEGSGRISDDEVAELDTTPVNVADLQENPGALPIVDPQANKTGEIPIGEPVLAEQPAAQAAPVELEENAFPDVKELDNNEQPTVTQ